MQTHDAGDYPRTFRYIKGIFGLMLDDFIQGLVFNQEDYSPILHIFDNGDLKYEKVPHTTISGFREMQTTIQFQRTGE